MAGPFFRKAVAITPSDVTVYEPPLQAIYIGGAGNLTVQLADGVTNITLTAPAVGSTHYLQARQVRAATTATLLVGMWD